MKSFSIIAVSVLFLMGMYSCEEKFNENTNNSLKNTDPAKWLIPISEVRDGGPGKDGIPALANPELKNASETTFMNDDDLVIGIKIGDETRAYQHFILDWHEIINDQINDIYFAITYCPLTGTGIAWNRKLANQVTTFGVSGLLYNSNLLPYDRATDSYWSQMRLDCVNGERINQEIETYPIIETTWKTWKTMYPNTKLVSLNTGYSRNYGTYPYGSYRTDDNYIIFPVSNYDNRVANKERVHGIIDGENTKVYRFSEFTNDTKVILDEFSCKEVVLIGNETDNFIVSFYTENTSGITFSAIQNEYPLILEDSRGNKFDVFGVAIEGPNKGEVLSPTQSFIGYWFSWAAFYPSLEIYE